MIYLVQHDRIGLLISAALIALAVRVWRASRKVERDLDIILGPGAGGARPPRGQAWERMTR